MGDQQNWHDEVTVPVGGCIEKGKYDYFSKVISYEWMSGVKNIFMYTFLYAVDTSG